MKTNRFRRNSFPDRGSLLILTVLLLAVCLPAPAGAVWTVGAEPMGSTAGLAAGSLQWGDCDNDGDLDLAVLGNDGANRRLIVWKNNGAGAFPIAVEPMGANLGLDQGSVQWGDFDNDGDLDLAVTGYDGANRRLIVWQNDGAGAFTRVAEPMGANAGVDQGSLQWGDYDNDGDLDLAVSGYDGANRRVIIFRNDGGGSFAAALEPMGTNAGVHLGALQWCDYDTDGDLDLGVSGFDGASRRVLVFRNDNADTFTQVAEPMGTAVGVDQSSLQWGDYDNDGDFDLAVAGDTGGFRRLIIFRNNGEGFTPVVEPLGVNGGVSSGSLQWGDYDHDGDPDLAVAGDTGAVRRLIVARNDAGNFAYDSEPLGADTGLMSGASVQWGDYDNNGTLDLAALGNDGLSRRLVILKNDTTGVNVRPAAPAQTLPTDSAVLTVGDTVIFDWAPPADDATPAAALTYHLRIGTTPGGGEILAADTDPAHAVDGAPLGNVQTDSAWLRSAARLGAGSYYWSVQAVDGGQMRSLWSAERAFIVLPDTSGANAWYVNDNSQAGDSFTATIGNNAAFGLSTLTPKLTIGSLVGLLTEGDTIYVDAGTYAETTVLIDTSGVSVIGADSAAVTITAGPGDYAFNVVSCSGATLANLGIRGAAIGVWLDTTAASEVRSCSFAELGSGLKVSNASGDTFTSLLIAAATDYGIKCDSVSYSLIQDVIVEQAGKSGITVDSSANNQLIRVQCSASATEHGIQLRNSNNTLLSECRTDNNWSHGVYFADTSSQNRVVGCIANGNNDAGYYLAWGCEYDTFTNNLAMNNRSCGFGSDGSRNNTFIQNQSDSNTQYPFALLTVSGPAGTATATKNNFRNSSLAPESGVLGGQFAAAGIGTADTFDFRRNYWATTDRAVIISRVIGIPSDSFTYIPFRLGDVDTAAGADTIAPAAPSAVSAADSSIATFSCTVTWTAPTTNEEEGSALADLAGYRLYRSNQPVPDDWGLPLATLPVGNTSYADSGLAVADYYYTVTAYDNHAPWPNESWYADAVLVPMVLTTDTPQVTFALADGYDTNATPIQLRGTVLDDAETPAEVTLAYDAVSETVAVDTGGFFSDTIFLAGAATSVTVTCTDGVGNVATLTVIINYDTTAPTVSDTAVLINGDSEWTGEETVVLTLTRDPTAVEMMVAADSAFTGAVWQPFAETVTLVLAAGETEPAAYVQFRDTATNVSAVDSDTIKFDDTAPTIWRVTANGSESTVMTATPFVSLGITAADSNGLESLMLSESETFTGAAWQAFTDSVAWLLTEPGETHYLHVRVRDNAGNITTETSPAILYDNAGPELALASETMLFMVAAQTFGGTVADSSGTFDTATVAINGGTDSVLFLAGGTFSFPLTLLPGLTTLRFTAADTFGNVTTRQRIVALTDTVIQPTVAETTVVVPSPLAPDTGTLAVDLPTADTLTIVITVAAGGGALLGDSWVLEINARDSGVNVVARDGDPADYNAGTDQLSHWDEFNYTIFRFDVFTDTGDEISDSPAAFDSIIATFNLSEGSFQQLDAAARATLNLFRFDEAGQRWDPVGGAVLDVNAGTVRAPLEHFSIYGVFAGVIFGATAADLSNLVIYPNPYVPNDGNPANGVPYVGPGDGSGIYVNGLVPGTTIEIYDLRGRLVDQMTVPAGTGVVQWDARNESGDEVATGVYFAIFRNGNEQRVEKVFIVR